MALPVFRAAGTIASGTGAISPGLPAGIEVGDLLVMFVETANQAVTVSGWTEAGSSPSSEATDATRLTVFWRRALGGDPTTTSDSGDHQIARIIAIRGVIGTGDPFHITSNGTDTTSDTSGSIPGGTTTINDCFAIMAASAANDPAANGTANFSSWTNSDLASVTERIDNVRTDGNGGGIGVATGTKATAGSIGNTSVTYAVATRKAYWFGALLPTIAVSNFSDNFDDNSIDTTKWSNWGGAQVAETSQHITITIPNATANYYGMEAVGRWSLVGSSAHVQLVSISDTTPDELEVEFQCIATAAPSNRLFFLVSGHATTPVLHAYKEVNDVLTDNAQVNYNPATMQWLRFRESGGTTYWEYSADGSSWTTLHSESNPITLTDCSIQLDSGCWDTTHGQVVVTYDNFNVAAGTAYTPSHNDNVSAADAISQVITKVIGDSATVSGNPTQAVGKNRNDNVAASEAVAQNVGNTLADNATAADATTQTVGKNIADATDIEDAISHVATFARSHNDGVSVSDAQARAQGHLLQDNATAADAIAQTVGNTLADDAEVNDDLTGDIVTSQDIADGVDVSDATTQSIGKNRNDNVSAAEAMTQAVGKFLLETVGVSEVVAKAAINPIADNATASDALAETVGKNKADNASVTDALVQTTTKAHNDAVGVSEAIMQAVGKNRADAASVADTSTQAIGKNRADNATVTDAVAKLFTNVIADGVEIADLVSHVTVFGVLIADTVTAAELVKYDVVKHIDDAVGAMDAVSKLVGNILADNVQVDDLVSAVIPGGTIGGVQQALGQNNQMVALAQKGYSVELSQKGQATILTVRR